MNISADVHVHVGNFNGGLYFAPEEVVSGMKALGVTRYYFSSTSTGSMPFRYVRREIETAIEFSEGSAVPFLWVSPGMLRHSRDLKPYLFREFAGLKVHGLQGWDPHGRELRRVFGIARDMGLPVMLHTGEHDICRAGAYMNICSEFPEVRVILAHGRPVNECAEVMQECPNAYADTAFMPVKSILALRDAGLMEKVLWGSDYPVMRYFYRTPPRRYYANRIKAVIKALGREDFIRYFSSANFLSQPMRLM